MTMNQFRLAAVALIAFNALGSVATWVAGLQNPKVGVAYALGGGTQFTGPLVLLFLACGALALTYTQAAGCSASASCSSGSGAPASPWAT